MSDGYPNGDSRVLEDAIAKTADLAALKDQEARVYVTATDNKDTVYDGTIGKSVSDVALEKGRNRRCCSGAL